MSTASSIFSSVGEIDNTKDDARQRSPLVLGGRGFSSITNSVSAIAERPTTLGWKIAFMISLSFLGMLGACIGYLITTGVGVWGNNQPAAWGFPIVNFVFWVGIGHAGTLISAILFLFRQNWRTGINRFAEAMTIFAVVCAGMFPGIHVGRAWLAYWLFPLPNQMTMWPQFRSPLLWDVFAVGTYATVSTLFWYVGMIPDLATLRDRSKSKIGQFAYGLFALGWNGSCRHWHRFERMYLLLAALATPLVLSVHSVVSFDFATSQLPGWHTTIFPPYFVAGAVYGGFAMVLNLAIPARKYFGLEDIITLRHIENCCKVMLATGMIVAYAYTLEFWTAWFGGNHFERFAFYNRAFGPYAWSFWVMIFCNVVAPQFLWVKKFRTNLLIVFIIATFANIGMWFERFEIIITSLTRDFLPSSWFPFKPTPIDLMMLAGSFGLFFTLFLLFCRFLPVVAMAEVKSVMPQAHAHGNGEHGDTHKSDFQPDEHHRPGPGVEPSLTPA
ncbi:MAG TPA: NrfD/PsrC family molybdoenzyme membrane anchor subunit [Tepidisphaeraceae bacterium]|jgi:molybdopterin-containing oxidoreductase family membrane subunit|nr:NrfD/PsrC family molybdoenzyme membrane anchor subunit [Tepidisphaeraceae bacterium]